MSLHFADFLKQEDDTETPEAPSGEPQKEIEAEQTEATEEQPEEQPVITFESRMKAKGFEIPDEIDPEDLYDQAIERIAAAGKALEENSKLRSELEKLQSAAQQSSETPAEAAQESPQKATETPQELGERLFKELKSYDPTLNGYVKRQENGRVVPDPTYGNLAIEAAQTINAFEDAERQQAKLLLSNPNKLIEENRDVIKSLAKEEADRIVQERFSAWQAEELSRKEEAEKQAAEASRQRELDEFHAANRDKIFNIGQDGQPLKSAFGDQPSTTKLGQAFFRHISELQQELPQGTPEITLMKLALRQAQLEHPATAQNAPSEPKPPVQTQAEKRESFIQQRSTSIPQQNTPQATPTGDQAPRRFAALARAIPQNQEVMASW